MKTHPSSPKRNVTSPGRPGGSLPCFHLNPSVFFVRTVRSVVCAMLVAAAPCAIAEEDLGGWTGFKEEISDPDGSGGSCFVLKPGVSALSKTLIPVDPEKSYKLSGQFSSQDGGDVRLFFGE